MVKLPHPILIVATFLLAACTQLATVKEINLAPVGLQVVPSKDRLVSLDDHIRLAEAASHKLERNPGDDQARREYNFAVARICGSLRQSKLTPWAAPVKLASHTLTWKRDPHPEMDPAKYEFIPADQLGIARLEPYDPNKTVVLLVHGLASSPTTWFPLLNQLRNDPAIRDNY